MPAALAGPAGRVRGENATVVPVSGVPADGAPADGGRADDGRADGVPAAAEGSAAVSRHHAVSVAVAVLLAAVYAWFAAGTTPFTLPADVVTAVPVVGTATVYALQRFRSDGGPWRRLDAGRPPAGGTAVPWIVVVALLVGSELASYVGGPRATHPTVSSLTDTIFQWQGAKAAFFFGWMYLSWYFVRR